MSRRHEAGMRGRTTTTGCARRTSRPRRAAVTASWRYAALPVAAEVARATARRSRRRPCGNNQGAVIGVRAIIRRTDSVTRALDVRELSRWPNAKRATHGVARFLSIARLATD